MRLSRQVGFRYPIDPVPRTAILVPWFGQNWFGQRRSRTFPRGWCEEAASHAPAAIAATRQQLVELAEAEHPPVLTHASIVLARKGEPMLSAADRERLWRAFRVPIFEQIIGPRGELLAAECEAHDGLHIETSGLDWAGYIVESALCACGRATPRVIVAGERIRSAAAYAR